MNLNTITILIALGLAGMSGCQSPADARAGSPEGDASLAGQVAPVVDDGRLYAAILKAGGDLISAGRTTKMATLIGQLERKRCAVALTVKPGREDLQGPRIYAQDRAGVLIMAGMFKCGTCADWHAGCSSGFVLTGNGVAVTNYHVVNHPESETLVAATADGRVLPVQAVLAASESDDIAIVQLGGDHLQALPLLADAPVGSRVCVIGHPSGRFYTLSEGIVSRYFLQADQHAAVPRMAITADFAVGSSGGPVFDTCGNVVGMVAGTTSIYYTHDKGRNDNLQMVMKYCVPVRSIAKLIIPPT